MASGTGSQPRKAVAAPQDIPALPARYRPVRHLGRGGCAEVILADDTAQPAVPKAVKILLPNLPASVVAGFREEFHILTTLEHPGLARVYEFGQLADGRAYYTGEYIDGRDLGVAGATVAELCLATAVVCRTLAFIHARGYIHNDVKPSNVLVPVELAQGEQKLRAAGARLLDFGLAGIDRSSSRTIAGTPGYIAPERLAGKLWDGRADLYAVGATLYRVLGKRRVVRDEAPGEALGKLRAGTKPLGELRADLPDALCALVDDLLKLDPTKRPRHPGEVIARLGEVLGERLPLETPGTARCYALASAFVGRRFELGVAERVLGGAGQGRGARMLVLAGAPGTGKSRLLRELAWRAETAGWRVAAVECSDRDGPTGPLERLAALCGAPEEAASAGGDACAIALGDAAAGGGRMLFAIDQAHRAADSTWHAAFALARRASADGAGILVVLAFDPDALPTTARRWLALGAGETERVDLPPLSAGDLRTMLASLFGEGVIPDALAESIARQSGGNPLLTEELVRDLVETGVVESSTAGFSVAPGALAAARRSAVGARPGSARLEEFLRRRWAGLPPEGARTLAALGALGGGASMDALSAVAGAGTDVRLGVSLLAERSLILLGDRVAVAHEAAGTIALDGLPQRARREIFRAAATWLSAQGADDAELARAFRGAGDDAAAFEHALAAGRRALQVGEGRLAVRFLDEARAAMPAADTPTPRQAEVEKLCGESYEMVGRLADALGAFARAFDLLPAELRGERVRLAALAVRPALLSGDLVAADSWLEKASAALPPGDLVARALVDARAGLRASVGRRFRQARDRMLAALATVDRLPPDPEVDKLRVRVLITLVGLETRFDIHAARSYAGRAIGEAERIGDRSLLFQAVSNLGYVELMAGDDFAAAVAAFERAAEECRRTGDVAHLPLILVNLAEVEQARGGREAARAQLERAYAAEPVLSTIRGGGIFSAWQEDDRPRLEREAAAALERGQSEYQFVPVMAVAASLAAARGNLREARDLAARAEVEALSADTPLDAAWASVARAYAAAAEDGAVGAARLREAADGLVALGHRAYVPPIRRDADRLAAGAGGARPIDRARPAPGGPARAVEVTGVATLGDSPSALSGAAASRLLELTLGPIELRHGFGEIVGRSPVMQRALQLLDRLADSDVPVLLTGETGTGKEVFARALHSASPRAHGPFVAINCAAIPATLFEAELFGYKRGAFTGAVRDHVGVASQADAGTLLLDEVGDLPAGLQPKLLRMLEERRIRPVGGDREVAIDVRVLAATNRDLGAAVTAGRFRDDLYYRLNVVEIRLPPLRERLADIPELGKHILASHGRTDQEFSPGAVKALASYHWPGNVRELENELLRASVLAATGAIHRRHLSQKIVRASTRSTPVGGRGTLAERMAAVEREIVREELRKSGGNRNLTARSLGLTRQGLRLKLIRLGLQERRSTARKR